MSDAPRGTSLGRDAWLRFRKNRLAMTGAIFVGLVAVIGYSAPLISRYVTHFSPDEQHTDFKHKPPGTRDISKDYRSYDGELAHFDVIDLNGDDRIQGDEEFENLYWIDRFFLFLVNDYDIVSEGEKITPALRRFRLAKGAHPDEKVSKEEYPDDYEALNENFREDFAAFVFSRLTDAQKEDSAKADAMIAARWKGLKVDEAVRFERVDENGDGQLDHSEINAHRWIYRPFESTERALQEMDEDGDGVIARSEYPGAPRLHTFWLGTDHLGRCVLTRIVYGARISITIALAATLVSFLIGVTWGSIAGYYGGRTDSLMMRIVDVLYGLPFMFIVILLIVIFGRSTINLFIALGAVQWLTMSRVVRGQVLSLKNREFIQAAEAIGVPRHKIVFRHLLRNTVGPVIVYSTLMIPAIILEEAFLSFLGLGVQPPDPSWGNMITDGANVMDTYTWLALYPGLALGLTLFSMNFVGDGIRDALDPQMQKD